MSDLVAELTLRLRNEMASGIGEARSQFTSLEEPLVQLRTILGEVDALMADMRTPPGMAALEGIDAEADATMAAIREVGAALDTEVAKAQGLFKGNPALAAQLEAAEELRKSYVAVDTAAGDANAIAQQIGATLTADAAQMQQMLVEMHQAQQDMATPIKEPPNSLSAEFQAGAVAAGEMANAVGNIGNAIDIDTQKMQQLLVEMHQAQEDMRSTGPQEDVRNAGAPAQSEGAAVPPVLPPSPPGSRPDDEEPEEPGSSSSRQSGGSGHGFDLFGLILGGITGLTGFDQWSDYDTAAKQIAVTEGLGPKDAQQEASRLKDMMNNIADQYYASSKDLMATYGFLITDSLSKQTVESMLPPMAEASTAYNVPTFDIAQAAFTLTKNLGIAPEHMGDALAVLHHATMMGHFNMEDFSQGLPEIGGQESLIGMTGMPADVTTAAALEMIRRNTGTGGEAATGLKEFLTYLHSMMALRMFDRTKRMEDMLGPSGKAIMEKYHIEPLDLPQFLTNEQKIGVDPINAMTAYFSHLLEPVKSPIERADLVGAYFHNLTAQDAILALVQYQHDFVDYQGKLSHVSDKTLATDFDTATSGASSDARQFHENLSQGMRTAGRLFDYPLELGNWIWNPNVQHGPPAPADNGSGHGASGITLTPQIPITVNVHVDKDGNATVTGGLAGAPNIAPGTNVRVNQGNVLTGVH